MKLIQRIIYTGFAAIAIASAAMPVFPSVPQDPDFEWYARVGHDPAPRAITQPPPRPGWIWSPQRWEWNGREHVWVEGRWVRDDYAEQVFVYNHGVPAAWIAQGPAPREAVIERR